MPGESTKPLDEIDCALPLGFPDAHSQYSQLKIPKYFRHIDQDLYSYSLNSTLSFVLCLSTSLTGFAYPPESCHAGLVNFTPCLISDRSLSHHIVAQKNWRQRTLKYIYRSILCDSHSGQKILFIDDDNIFRLDIPYVLLSNDPYLITSHYHCTSARQSTNDRATQFSRFFPFASGSATFSSQQACTRDAPHTHNRHLRFSRQRSISILDSSSN